MDSCQLDSAWVSTAMFPGKDRERRLQISREDIRPDSTHSITAMHAVPAKYGRSASQVLTPKTGLEPGDDFTEHKASLERSHGGFELQVDARLRSYSFNPFGLRKGCGLFPMNWGHSTKTNPHMRAFWFATGSFFLAFTGWFALAPLMPVIRESIGICDNQEAVDMGTAECICNADCKRQLGNVKIASLCSTVIMRISLGGLLERFGPRKVQCFLITMGAFFVASGMFITNIWSLCAVAALTGTLGSTFVTNQFWMPLMFAPSIVGTVSGTAGGWGNLGGGVANAVMPVFYNMLKSSGMEPDLAWRGALLFPAALLALIVPFMWCKSQDSPIGKLKPSRDLNKKAVSLWDYWYCLTDKNILILVFQYSACFGAELTMNWELAMHFKDNFGLTLEQAGGLTSFFGGMNLVARSLGGNLSDRLNIEYGMRGRLWIQFVCLLFEGIFLGIFGFMTKSIGWLPAFVVMVIFSLFTQMAEGTTYGIVPFAAGSNMGVVAALVGAGGNLGAVLCQAAFYKTSTDPYSPFLYHSVYVIVIAFATFLIKIPNYGDMLHDGKLARYCKGSLFCYSIEWSCNAKDMHTSDYGYVGSSTPPWRVKELLLEKKANSYVEDSKKKTFALGDGFVGKVAQSQEPLFIKNVHVLGESMFKRSCLAEQDGIKCIIMWPTEDRNTVMEIGSTENLELRSNTTVRDVVFKLDGPSPEDAMHCFKRREMAPSNCNKNFAMEVPFIRMLNPFFKYAIEWTMVDTHLQATGHYEAEEFEDVEPRGSFATDSYSFAEGMSTHFGVAVARNVSVLLQNVQFENKDKFARARLAQKHGIKSVLFFPSKGKLIEVGSPYELQLLPGKTGDHVVQALKSGTLAGTKLFKRSTFEQVYCNKAAEAPAAVTFGELPMQLSEADVVCV